MRAKVDQFQIVLTKAKRDQDVPKKYKETHGGQLVQEELKE
jgi:hypothetical protein